MHPQLVAKRIKDFSGEEGNLPFVVVLVIEKAVAANPMPGYTFDLRHLDARVVVR